MLKSKQEVIESLKARGVRPTVHRVALAMHILKEHRHFTADELFIWAEANLDKVSRATIYNCLNEFVAVGLIRAFYSSESSRLIYDSNNANHFHFYDSKTNQIFDIAPDQVQINSSQLSGYEIDQVDVVFRGRRIET